jgi:hypothetical protein
MDHARLLRAALVRLVGCVQRGAAETEKEGWDRVFGFEEPPPRAGVCSFDTGGKPVCIPSLSFGVELPTIGGTLEPIPVLQDSPALLQGSSLPVKRNSAEPAKG